VRGLLTGGDITSVNQSCINNSMSMITPKHPLRLALVLLATALAARAGTFTSDFNTGNLPSGSHTNANTSGGAYLELTGGVGDSGCLKLTKSINSQNGSFILDDLDAGQPIYGFDATFKLRIGGGTTPPADGFSLVVDPNLTDTSLFGETGTGTGLAFGWDIYNNPDTPPSPQIEVRVNGAQVAYKGYTVAGISTTGDVTTWWTDVHIHLNPDGSLNLDYQGVNVFTNLFLPNYQAIVDAGLPMRFGIGARTGGLNANQWVDNLQITTFTTPLVGISQQPFSQTIQQGDDAAFDVRVANTNGVTYQWWSNNVAIAGAVSQTLILTNVQPAFAGSQYKVIATGPNNIVTSSVVTLTVTNLTLPAPQLSFNFNEGTGVPPDGCIVTNSAFVDSVGGVGNSGVVKLVANPGESGALIVTNSAEAGQPVYGFTARFKVLVGGGTVPPADGFAFAFGNDIPDAPTGEFESGAGLGNGLRVTFDIYDNSGIFGYPDGEGNQPAPSIDVRYGNQVLGSIQLPISFMETGVNDDFTPRYQDTIIQLNSDGTINVVYHGALVFDHLPVPGFSSVTGGRFAIAARTGGLSDNIWVDDFQLTSDTTPGGIRITGQPVSQTILVNHSVTNRVEVNDPTGVTFQWFKNNQPISGANASTYVSPVAGSDSGATFYAEATKSSVTVTSDVVTLTVVDLSPPASPNLSYDFNDGLVPTGTAVYSGAGGGYITADGGVGNSGTLHLTDAVNGQSGAFVVPPLFGGAQASAISVAFDVRLGGGSGTPADGFSFNWAPGLPDGTIANAEQGTFNTTGLAIAFKIYAGNGSPYIGVLWKGATVATTLLPYSQLDTGVDYRKVLLRVDPDGKLYLSYGERILYAGLQLPNYTFLANAKFGIYGRTGGENDNQWFDNVQIQATQSSGPLSVATQPVGATVIAGGTVQFSVGLSDPNGASYQWQKQPAGGSFANIPGATASSYTTPPTTLADNGALFRVNATGPSGSATSSNALLTVVEPIIVTSPIVSYNFDDCVLPADTILTGTAQIVCAGGSNNSGILDLTDNINSQQGSFLMPDFNNNQPVRALTAAIALRIADGTGTPADGFSFCWGSSNSIPDTSNFGEGGAGDGLVVSLITYAGRPDGPSFNVWYQANHLVNKIVPYSELFTGDLSADPFEQYANLLIRVNENGTLDLQYKGQAILSGLPLPGYAALAGGRFALGARTGGENETHWVDSLQIATTTGLVPPTLGYSHTGNNLTLTWSAGFKLQSTGSLAAPVTWTDVPGAASPYITTTTGAGQFYRLAPTP